MPKTATAEAKEIVRKLAELDDADSRDESLRQELLDRLNAFERGDILLERLKYIMQRADEIGEVDPDFDVKAYLDEMWDEF
jgi:antitoxin VapB